MLRAFFRSTTGRFLSVLVLSLGIYHGWLSLAAPGKIAPEVAEALKNQEQLDVMVELRFPPERFHVLTFQRFGRVSGSRENLVELRGIPKDAIRSVARYYWVRKITLLKTF